MTWMTPVVTSEVKTLPTTFSCRPQSMAMSPHPPDFVIQLSWVFQGWGDEVDGKGRPVCISQPVLDVEDHLCVSKWET